MPSQTPDKRELRPLSQQSRRPSRRFSSFEHESQPPRLYQDDELAVPPSISPLTGSHSNSVAGSYTSKNILDMDHPDAKTLKKVSKIVPDPKVDSLQLQSGDVIRDIHNWHREHENEELNKRTRSKSVDLPPEGHPDLGLASDILVPGGFRREYMATHTDTDSIITHDRSARGSISQSIQLNLNRNPHIFTRNFIEFLSLYGHFAGEELEEEEALDSSDELTPSESTPLIQNQRERQRQQHQHHTRRLSHHQAKGQASVTETVLLLLKSFVGTGVLFLPRAFYNGGILFSSTVLVFVSAISYWCFLLLIDTKEHTKMSSFGDIGGALLGNLARHTILSSIVLSQIGFSSAYVVFVAENMRSFFKNLQEGNSMYDISTLIMAQLVVFFPLSMIRDIAKLGFTALIADVFILSGLIYLYSWSGFTLLTKGIQDVVLFNSSNWTLFIGTAVFTYEGIGLIIPIQESMREPKKFSSVLAYVMVAITVVFVSVGVLLYAATGSNVETVILLNLPNSALTSTIQLLYSIAILLSTPLQMFPAIRILENSIFVKSGKFSNRVKWQKNVFRFFIVIAIGIVAYFGADDLDKFVALTGSIACVPLVYIYPPLLHMKTVEKNSWAYISDILVAVLGAIMMIYTSTMTISSWASG